MYVSVAEKAGLQHSLAKAYSAIGIMYNTLVSERSMGFQNRVYGVCVYMIIMLVYHFVSLISDYSVTMKKLWILLVNVVKYVVNWMTQKPCMKLEYSTALPGDTK